MNKLERQERQQQEWKRYKLYSILDWKFDDEGTKVYEIKCRMCNGLRDIVESHLRECFDLGDEPVCYECMFGRGSDPEQFEDR